MPLPALLTLIQDVEAAGFDGVGVLDSQLLCRDTFVTLGLAAVNTSRLMLFPAVTNPFTRHVSVLASAVQTVDELAPGRTKVVIGTGYTSAHTIGRKPATLAEMRACITDLRALLAGQAVDFGTTSGRLGYASGRHIPVLMAASGPKAIELAGEVAAASCCRWAFSSWQSVQTRCWPSRRRGGRGGRKLEDLEIVWTGSRGDRCHPAGEASPAGQTHPVVHQDPPEAASIAWAKHAGLSACRASRSRRRSGISYPICPTARLGAAIDATSFVPDEVIAQLCGHVRLSCGNGFEYCAPAPQRNDQRRSDDLYVQAFQTFVGRGGGSRAVSLRLFSATTGGLGYDERTSFTGRTRGGGRSVVGRHRRVCRGASRGRGRAAESPRSSISGPRSLPSDLRRWGRRKRVGRTVDFDRKQVWQSAWRVDDRCRSGIASRRWRETFRKRRSRCSGPPKRSRS